MGITGGRKERSEGGKTVTSRKRWDQIYTIGNPFRLPQNLIRSLRKCLRCSEIPQPDMIRYLWIHVADDGFVPQQVRSERENHEMTVEDWLNVVDESAALGAEHVIISVGAPLAERPEVWEICRWAQSSHGMLVGIYVFGAEITREDIERLARFNREKTRLFVDSDRLDGLRYAEEEYGITLCVADGLAPGEPSPECHLPETMTCVGSNGTLYTCGLVLGHERFRLGEVKRERIDGVMSDGQLPHVIPEGVSSAPRRCHACPPLMERRMRGLRGH